MSSLHLSLLIIPLVFSINGFEEQYSWTGGPGLIGPYDYWDRDFHQALRINWSAYISDLILESRKRNQIDISAQGPRHVSLSDIDGDGDVDVIQCEVSSNTVAWLENPGGMESADVSVYWEKHTVTDSMDYPSQACSGDLNGDNCQDIVVAAWDSNSIGWWKNSDGAGEIWIENIIAEDCGSASCVSTADLDGDGDIDVAGASCNKSQVIWWENHDGTGEQWSEHVISENMLGVHSLECHDMDADGDMDVIATSLGNNEIAWWENTSGDQNIWVKHQVGECNVYNPRSFSVADFNNDGLPDVLSHGVSIGQFTWWENHITSKPRWIEHVIGGMTFGMQSCQAVDVDSDGDLDAVGCTYQDQVFLWENLNGIGTQWEHHILDETILYPAWLAAGDLNGDDRTDMVCAVFLDNQIVMWDFTMRGYDSQGYLESTILDSNQSTVSWGFWDWNAMIPKGTAVCFQFRTSDDPADMGEWSDTLWAPANLYDFLESQGRYLQYRAILLTEISSSTPILEYLSIAWYNVSTEEHNADPASDAILCLSENPAIGSVFITYSIPNEDEGFLFLYDIMGRVVSVTTVGGSQETSGSLDLTDMSTGVYLCRLTTCNSDETIRFTVIE